MGLVEAFMMTRSVAFDTALSALRENETAAAAALTLTVGFAGHRNLNREQLEPALERVFSVVHEALTIVGHSPACAGETETILDAYRAIWPPCSEAAHMRLLVGFASGADQLATQVWRRLELGRIHGLFPFADEEDPSRFAWTDDPRNARSSEVTSGQLKTAIGHVDLDAVTVLDGKAALNARPFRNPHLEQTRWLLRWSDLVIVAWNGEVAAGPGGTGDLVALALTALQPIIWIDTSDPAMPAKLIMPMRLWRDTTFDEAQVSLHESLAESDVIADLTIKALELPLLARLRPPSLVEMAAKDWETSGRRAYANGSLLTHPSTGVLPRHVSRLWPILHRRFGKPEPYPHKQDVRERGEQADTSRIIEDRLNEADAHAGILGDLHRSTQVVLLLLSAAAVAAGTFPGVIHQAKLYCVVIEFFLIFLAAVTYWHLGRMTNDRSWSDARRLAERLRALHATWPLGFDVGDEHADAPSTWTEWYARALRRSAGPPTGFLSNARRHAMAVSARRDLSGIVLGQSRYHKLAARRAHSFHRKLKQLEINATVFLLVMLFAYITAFLLSAHHLEQVGGILLMMSAVVPAIAAACLGIEAKLGLAEVAHRSSGLCARFQEIVNEMEQATQVEREEELLRAAATLLIADVDRWRDASAYRIIATF